jgi:hypothetical protein
MSLSNRKYLNRGSTKTSLSPSSFSVGSKLSLGEDGDFMNEEEGEARVSYIYKHLIFGVEI